MGRAQILEEVEAPAGFRRMLRAYIKKIHRIIGVDQVVLFGSRVYGDPLEESDLDLIIVSRAFKGKPFLERLIFLSMNWPGGYPLEVLGYTPDEIRRLFGSSAVVTEALKRGIRVKPDRI